MASLDIIQRKAAEEALRQAHDELEQRVADHTPELEANEQLAQEVEVLKRAEDELGLQKTYFQHLFENSTEANEHTRQC